MNKIKQKIMQTNFTKAFKRLLIAALCVAILGGGASVFLLRTQIGEIVSYARQEEMREDEKDSQTESGGLHGEEKDGKEQHDKEAYDKEPHGNEHGDLEDMITRPSTAAKAAVSITGLLCLLAGVAFWLLIAAWLYQSAVLSKMHGLIWFFLGLCGNLAAVVAFLLIRSLIRKKCDACGSYQTMKAQYCVQCGAVLTVKCPECGANNEKGNHYCHNCGSSLTKE